jgi:hypothetical protein
MLSLLFFFGSVGDPLTDWLHYGLVIWMIVAIVLFRLSGTRRFIALSSAEYPFLDFRVRTYQYAQHLALLNRTRIESASERRVRLAAKRSFGCARHFSRNSKNPEVHAPVVDGAWNCPECGGKNPDINVVCRDCGQPVWH